MDTENKDELFSIKLNQKGISYLLKYARIVKLFFILGITVTLVVLARNIIALFDSRPNYNDDFLNIFFTIYPYLSIAGIIIFVLQIIFYKRLADSLQYAIVRSDEDHLNEAFANLVKGVWYAMFVSAFSLVFTIADIIILIKFRS
jgi:choline-glycine betaine transporter